VSRWCHATKRTCHRLEKSREEKKQIFPTRNIKARATDRRIGLEQAPSNPAATGDTVRMRQKRNAILKMTPDELLTRLRAGKVWIQARHYAALRRTLNNADVLRRRGLQVEHTGLAGGGTWFELTQ